MSLKSIGAFANFGIHGDGPLARLIRAPLSPALPYWSTDLDQYLNDRQLHGLVLVGAFSPAATSIPVSVIDPGRAADVNTPPVAWTLDNWAGQVDALVRSHAGPATGWIVSARLLSRLADPRPLLGALKRLSLDEHTPILFVIEEKRAEDRTWTPAQFAEFLEASGFSIERRKAAGGAALIEARVDEQAYRSYLEKK